LPPRHSLIFRSSLVPSSVEHYLIWTVLPIFPPDLPPIIKPRLLQDGLWGFTGYTANSPPPSPSKLPTCLPALSDWGDTQASLIRSPRGTAEEEAAVRQAGSDVHKFIIATWKEQEWETAWFVNPPVSTWIKNIFFIKLELARLTVDSKALAIRSRFGTYPCLC
jgi:hypothetical protein